MGAKLRRRGQIYHLDVHQYGRRIRRTLKIHDRGQADIVRLDFEHSMLGGLFNVPLAVETPVARAVQRFKEEYETLHHAPSTRSHTRLTFSRFLAEVLSKYGPRATLDTVRPVFLHTFQNTLLKLRTNRNKPMSNAAVNRALREISALYSWAVNVGLCRSNPCSKVKLLREIRRLVEPATLSELRKLVQKLPDVYADLVRLIIYTGLRLGEALHLRREDISFGSRLLFVKSRQDYLIKDREERAIRLTAPALALCRRRIREVRRSILLFPTELNSLIDNRNALRELHGGCRKAGLRKMNWKLLRKTFATLQGTTLTPFQLKQVLGHQSVATTEKGYLYLRSRDCRLRTVVI